MDHANSQPREDPDLSRPDPEESAYLVGRVPPPEELNASAYLAASVEPPDMMSPADDLSESLSPTESEG